MNKLDSRITVLKQKIAKATKLSQRFLNPIRSFGTEGSLKFNSPISEEELIKIEQQYEVTFPAGYRAFITKIANGGSGPYYGLFSLEHSLKWSVAINNAGNTCYDFLKTPFIHTSKYNPKDHPYLNELYDRCDRGEITDEECDLLCDPIYDYLTAGTMIICHLGCGYYDRLVVTGETRGQIWADGECTDQGYSALNISFLDWYEQWLDEHFSE